MSWRELRLLCAASEADRLECTLETAGALAVSVDDAGDGPLFEPAPGEHPLWQRCRLTGLFADAAGAESALALIAAEHGAETAARVERREVAERDWVTETQQSSPATRFGRRLWVVPPGTPAPATDAAVVELVPGLAFGSGAHETTALCLEWLDEAALEGACVVDFGCGSGILAIAAARLGAACVHAFDHDPQALTATRDNATANGVGDRLHCGPEPDSTLAGRVDVLVANILAGTLCRLAPVLTGLLRPGGQLALAGILDHQVAAVRADYSPWCERFHTAARGEWVRLDAQRRAG